MSGRGRPGKSPRGPAEKRRRGFCLAGRPEGLPAHFRALSDADQHVSDHQRPAGQHVHEQFSDQSRRGRAEQQQRRGGLGQLQPGGLQQPAGCLWPDFFARRPDNRQRISGQPVHQLQPAHAGGGGAGRRRICRGLGFGAGTGGLQPGGHGFNLLGTRPSQIGRPAWTFMRGFTTAAACRGQRISGQHG